jgi:hypothetical protein
MDPLDALESSLSFAEIFATFACGVVAFGLFIEYRVEFAKALRERKIGALPLGALLVTLGVAAEFVFQIRTSVVVSSIRGVQHMRDVDQQAKIASTIERATKAEQQAAEATKRAEEERLERVKIEKAIIDQLAQRDIKKEQIETISAAVKGRIGTIYLYPLADPEASRFAFAISEALKAGGADVRLMLSGTRDVPVFPDKFNVAVSITGVTIYESDGKHETVDLLVRAFGEAGIAIQGQWTEKSLSGVVDGKWVADAGVQSPAIFVGLRPPPFSQFPAYATSPALEEFSKNHPPTWLPK